MRLPALRIGARIFLGFSFAALLMLIIAVVSVYYLQSVGNRLTTVAEQDRILQTNALELRVAVEQENDGVLSYLLSGNRDFLQEFFSAGAQYTDTARELEATVESAEERGSLSELETLHQSFLTLANEQVTLRDQGFPASSAFLWQTQGSEAKSALSDGLARFIDLQEQAISRRVRDAEDDQNRAAGISLTVLALGGLIGLFGAVALVRSITNPIKQLVTVADAIGRGDFAVRTSIRGGDELAQLGGAIGQMAEDLEESRRKMEELLQQERQRAEQMHAVMISAPIVLFAIDRKGVFTLSEGKALKALGLEGGELVGKSIFEQFAHHPEILHNTRQALGGEEVTATVDEKGSTFETRYSPIRDESGEVVAVIGVATDITQRVQAEAELLQQTHELAVLGERNRLAREIHDTLAQGFTGIVLQLEAAEQAIAESPPEAMGHLNKARSLARESLQEARRSVWNLRPRALETESLDGALRAEVERFASARRERADFEIAGDKRDLPSQVQAALLRICQESLTNVRRYAEATQVKVKLHYYPEEVALSVSDDGIGMRAQPQSGGEHFGLIGMKERAGFLGGTLRITSEEGKGTSIEVRIPAK